MRVFVAVLLLVACACAQTPPSPKRAAIQSAKRVLISEFDISLPRISLEYFLDYEGEGAPIDWLLKDCPGNHAKAPELNTLVCVEATLDLRDGRVVAVVIAVPSSAMRVPGSIAFRSVTVTDQGSSVRSLRLIELPAAIHRLQRNPPRDLPRQPALDALLMRFFLSG